MENYASSALSAKLTINVIHDSLYVTVDNYNATESLTNWPEAKMLLTEWATWHLSVLYWVSPSSVGDYSALLAVTVNRQPGKSYSNIRLTTVQYGFVSLGICGLMLTVWSKKQTKNKQTVCCVRNSKVYGFIGCFLFLQCECRWACVLISVICILLTFLHVKHGCILTIHLPYRSSFFTSTSDFWKITRWNLLSFPFLQLNLSPSLLAERTMKRNLYSLPENGRTRGI